MITEKVFLILVSREFNFYLTPNLYEYLQEDEKLSLIFQDEY